MTFWGQTFWGLFQKGGFAMWPLLACSVMALAIIAQRFYFHFTIRLDEAAFRRELKQLLMAKKRNEALALCQASCHPVPKIAEQYLLNLLFDSFDGAQAPSFRTGIKAPLRVNPERNLASYGEDSRRVDAQRTNILKCEGSLLLEGVEKNLKGLATIAHLAPLLGLLGTVTGLVSAFHQIEILGGQVQAGNLAGGIWEALITTVFGLVVAIPATAFFHYFENKTDFIARRMQLVISELDRFFGKETRPGFRPLDAEDMEDQERAVR